MRSHPAGENWSYTLLCLLPWITGTLQARQTSNSAPPIRDAGPTTRDPARPARSGSLEGGAGAAIEHKSASHDPIGELGKPPRVGSSLGWSPASLPKLQRVPVVSLACLLVAGIWRSLRIICHS